MVGRHARTLDPGAVSDDAPAGVSGAWGLDNFGTPEAPPSGAGERQRPAEPALESNSRNLSGSGVYDALDGLRKFSWSDAQKLCMRRARGSGVTVGRRDGKVTFGGAQPCGRRYCPHCGPRIQAVRRDEIEATVAGARDAGWTTLFLTLTLGHSIDDQLSDLLDGIFASWKALTRGGFWSRIKRRHGLRHFVRVVEVKEGGANGWHPHVHVLLFLDRAAATHWDPEALGVLLGAEWGRVVTAAGFRASMDAQRLVEPSEEQLRLMSSYFTKELARDLAWELTGELTKENRSGAGSRNPSELLAAAIAGDAIAQRHFVELEEATHGRQLVGWSAHCRRDLALPPAMPAGEAAEDPTPVLGQQPPECLVRLRASVWDDFSAWFGLRQQLVDLVEAGESPEALVAWLGERGITATVAEPAPATVLRPPEAGPPGREWLAEL